jgi:hypothetical protein
MSEALRTASEEAPFLNLVAVLATLSNDLTPQQFSDYTQELAIVCISELPDDMGGTSIDKDALVEKLSKNGAPAYMFADQLVKLKDSPYANLTAFADPSYYDTLVDRLIRANGSALYLSYGDVEGTVAYFTQDSGVDSQEVTKNISSLIEGDLKRGVGEVDDIFNLTVDTKEEGGDTSVSNTLEPNAYRYEADSMSSRRPDGDFFMVDMVASTETAGSPRRVDIDGPNGQKISSLKLNMSPQSLVVNAAKKINRVQTMIRWAEEHWGDEMDQISFSGSTFAFIHFPKAGEKAGGGLCVDSRNLTAPFQELQHLVNIYKTNGAVYQEEELGANEQPREFFNYGDPSRPILLRRHPRAGFIKYRLYIRLRCDFAEFIGYFESFDITEDASSPFKLSYKASFKSEFTKWL